MESTTDQNAGSSSEETEEFDPFKAVFTPSQREDSIFNSGTVFSPDIPTASSRILNSISEASPETETIQRYGCEDTQQDILETTTSVSLNDADVAQQNVNNSLTTFETSSDKPLIESPSGEYYAEPDLSNDVGKTTTENTPSSTVAVEIAEGEPNCVSEPACEIQPSSETHSYSPQFISNEDTDMVNQLVIEHEKIDTGIIDTSVNNSPPCSKSPVANESGGSITSSPKNPTFALSNLIQDETSSSVNWTTNDPEKEESVDVIYSSSIDVPQQTLLTENKSGHENNPKYPRKPFPRVLRKSSNQSKFRDVYRWPSYMGDATASILFPKPYKIRRSSRLRVYYLRRSARILVLNQKREAMNNLKSPPTLKKNHTSAAVTVRKKMAKTKKVVRRLRSTTHTRERTKRQSRNITQVGVRSNSKKRAASNTSCSSLKRKK